MAPLSLFSSNITLPMARHLLYLAVASALVTRTVFATPQNVPPSIAGDVELLGHTSDPGFATGDASVPNDPGYVSLARSMSLNPADCGCAMQYSDGGAGGLVNGYHLLTLSDARVLQLQGALVHTVYAFTRPDDPTDITILGDYTQDPHFYLQGPNGNGQGVIASDPNDNCDGPKFAPAPNTMMIPLGNGTGGMTVWSVFCGSVQYNTLIEFRVEDLEGLAAASQNIPAQRTVLKLFDVRA
nr:hypothetical protein CFP56_44240 [Quercus suber]